MGGLASTVGPLKLRTPRWGATGLMSLHGAERSRSFRGLTAVGWAIRVGQVRLRPWAIAVGLVAACGAAPHIASGAPNHTVAGSPAPSVATIDLNQATRAEIESVRAVGVELTERLLQARSAGPFGDWQDLRRRVKGVGRQALAGFAEAGFQIKGQPPPTRP